MNVLDSKSMPQKLLFIWERLHILCLCRMI